MHDTRDFKGDNYPGFQHGTPPSEAMVVLTENLVLARARAENLESVKNLNLWGNDLTDLSILKELVNCEVLSLSVNKISTLSYFQYSMFRHSGSN